MAFPVFQLDRESVERHRRLFPGDIETDEWVIFHGTSGFNAEFIERDGFYSANQSVSPAQIRRVITIFEKMKWCGEDLGGYAVLKPFSLDHDFRSSENSLIFFAEARMRALVYATRDFSGGEKLRALRRAFNDLESYLNDSHMRLRHYRFMKGKFDGLSLRGAASSELEAARPIRVDLHWFRRELADLCDIRRIAHDAYRLHDHGAVYALRMTEDDVEHLNWNSFMGLETRTQIPPSRIVAKAIVPAE